MKEEIVLFEDTHHKVVQFSFDSEEEGDRYLAVHQFLIIQNNSAILVDPGSTSIFEELQAAIERHISVENIRYIFFSHQDPDVAGAIAEWDVVAPQAKFVISKLWVRFMSHYGFTQMDRIVALPDHGAKIMFGHDYLQFIPAHFLHSPGNFSLFDSRSGVIFSGDIGASIVGYQQLDGGIDEFEKHIASMIGFHQRYLAGHTICQKWVQHVRAYPVKTIAPQHGAMMQGEHVEAFLAWLDGLSCGGDLWDEFTKGPNVNH